MVGRYLLKDAGRRDQLAQLEQFDGDFEFVFHRLLPGFKVCVDANPLGPAPMNGGIAVLADGPPGGGAGSSGKRQHGGRRDARAKVMDSKRQSPFFCSRERSSPDGRANRPGEPLANGAQQGGCPGTPDREVPCRRFRDCSADPCWSVPQRGHKSLPQILGRLICGKLLHVELPVEVEAGHQGLKMKTVG
jgi:hypothetical protein